MYNRVSAAVVVSAFYAMGFTVFAACPTAPLSVYLAPGFTCTENVFTIKSFTFGQAFGVSADQITVTPIETPSAIGFRFAGPFSTPAGQVTTYGINYFIDPPPPIIRGEQITTEIGTLETTLCPNTGEGSCVYPLAVLTANAQKPTDSVIFDPPLNMLAVQNMLTLVGPLGPSRSSRLPVGQPGFVNLALLIPPAAAATETQGAYQLRYLANLQTADSYINATNAGTFDGFDPNGRICANFYVFDPREELVSCCSCLITPNGLVSLSARNDLINNTLTGAPLTNGITVKALASLPTPVGGTTCNPSSPTAATLVGGLKLWAVTPHGNTGVAPPPPAASAFMLAETEFAKAELSANELSKLTGFCRFIQVIASNFGICRSCPTVGAQGAGTK